MTYLLCKWIFDASVYFTETQRDVLNQTVNKVFCVGLERKFGVLYLQKFIPGFHSSSINLFRGQKFKIAGKPQIIYKLSVAAKNSAEVARKNSLILL